MARRRWARNWLPRNRSRSARRLRSNSWHRLAEFRATVTGGRCVPVMSGTIDLAMKRSKVFRTGVDDPPEIRAVLDLLHLGGQPAIAADPVLHRLRVIGHQVRCSRGTGDLDSEGKRLVVIGLVEAEAGARRHAYLVHRHDAEHQRAGRIAKAIDDDALLAVADALVLRLVFLDIAAVIARDTQIGARRAHGQQREQ